MEPQKGPCTVQLEFRRNVVCNGNEEAFQYLLNLEAKAVQKPKERLGVGILLLGGPGAGKSTLARQMGSFFEPDNKREFLHQFTLTSRYNGWMANARFVFVDEVKPDKTVDPLLHSLVAEDMMMVESKGAWHVARNRIKLYVASNQEDYDAPASGRRWATFRLGNVEREHDAYFQALWEDWELRKGKEAYLDFLLRRDISGFDPLQRPAQFA